MRIVAFLGPSLYAAEAQALCPCEVRPPVRRGDIAALMDDPPDAIAIVDGAFEQVPSVWHKEILFALSCGVRVAGAASMGALRAAELSQFGMVGVGRIFEAYRSGRFAPYTDPFEDDDEVAVIHGPAELGYPASDALVDMRATFAAAADAGILTMDDARSLVASARSIFFKDRTYGAVLARTSETAVGPARSRLDAFAQWLPQNAVRQKRADAAALLEALAAGGLTFSTPAFRFEPTLLWERWHGAGTGGRQP